MAKKKNYLNNSELKEEILNCITTGYNKAVKNGFDSTLPVYDDGSSESDVNDNDKTLKLGYIFNSDDKEVIEKQFESYKELGGNSFVKDLVVRVLNLPIDNSTI